MLRISDIDRRLRNRDIARDVILEELRINGLEPRLSSLLMNGSAIYEIDDQVGEPHAKLTLMQKFDRTDVVFDYLDGRRFAERDLRDEDTATLAETVRRAVSFGMDMGADASPGLGR
jgi:hypothetical protein